MAVSGSGTLCEQARLPIDNVRQAAEARARELQLVARNARRIYERSASLLEVLRAAAPIDEVLALTWEEIAARRLERSRRTARSIMAKTKYTRMKREDTALTLWSLTAPELFTTYLAGGRIPDQYERWLSDLLLRALLEVPASTS